MQYYDLDPERIKGYIYVFKAGKGETTKSAKLLYYNVTTNNWVILDVYVRTKTGLLRSKTGGFKVSNREWHILHTSKEFWAIKSAVGI